MDYEYRPMFSVSQLAAFFPNTTFIDRDDGDLERNACKLRTPCYPFHHVLDALIGCFSIA